MKEQHHRALTFLFLFCCLQFLCPGRTVLAAPAAGQLPTINAKQAVIVDNETGRRLYEKEADKQVPMASTTKIMTALVVLEECELTDLTTVSRFAAETDGSSMQLAEGEVISVQDLLYGLLLNSGNDAAVALAEHVGGSVQDFCNLMNRKAKELGLHHTNFTSPHGLDADGHYTTAYELSLIARKAMENPTFRTIVSTDVITVNGHYCNNTNPLLGIVDGVDGIKTGYTDKAGRCLVLSAERNGLRVIIVLLGCDSSPLRVQDGKTLIEFAMSSYRTYTIYERGAVIATPIVHKGTKTQVALVVDEKIRLTLTEEEYRALQTSYTLPGEKNELESPVRKGQPAGLFVIFTGTAELYRCDLIASETVTRKNFWDYLQEIFTKWSGLFRRNTLSAEG